MLSNYFTIKAITEEVASTLVGNSIEEISSQEKDVLAFGFAPPLPALVVSCLSQSSVLFLSPGFARQKRNTADLFTSAWGHSVKEVRLHPADRIVTLALDDDRQFHLRFFGGASNVLLVSAQGAVETAFRKARDLAGSMVDEIPRELVFDFDTLHRMPPDCTAPVALRRLFPVLGGTLVAEALCRAGVESTLASDALSDDQRERLTGVLQAILLEVQHPTPRVYVDASGAPAVFSLIPLKHLDALSERLFPSVSEAARFFVSRRKAVDAVGDKRTSVVQRIRQHIERAERTLEAVRKESGDADRAGQYEAAGTQLLAHLGSFVKGDARVTLPGEGGPTEIVLDRRLGPVQNAQRYFEKAKRARSAAALAVERTVELRHHITLGASLIERLEQVATMEELKTLMQAAAGDFQEFGIGAQGPNAPLPFRRFVVDGGFEVWAGKSSENNDALTLHHARPQDLWFHARGAGGSHVVLRVGTGKGEPGKKAKEQAAAIAAYYSKMKNAGLVPVAMTEKKYVRKPKGAKPGSVTLEREKVLFVRPGLPEGEPGT